MDKKKKEPLDHENLDHMEQMPAQELPDDIPAEVADQEPPAEAAGQETVCETAGCHRRYAAR